MINKEEIEEGYTLSSFLRTPNPPTNLAKQAGKLHLGSASGAAS